MADATEPVPQPSGLPPPRPEVLIAQLLCTAGTEEVLGRLAGLLVTRPWHVEHVRREIVDQFAGRGEASRPCRLETMTFTFDHGPDFPMPRVTSDGVREWVAAATPEPFPHPDTHAPGG